MANGEGGEQKDDSEGRTGTVGSGSVYSFAGIRLLNKPNQEGTEEIQEEEGKEKEMTKMIFFR
jgi:hypothetical protein